MRLAYVEAGPPDAEPVLLLHGEPSWSFLYRTVMAVLADAGLRAIAPDLAGFGRSDKPMNVSDLDEIAAQANDSPYGLGAGIWTKDISKAHALAKKIRAGSIYINCYNVFDAALPFGGYKQSGWGREMGHEVLNNYTEVKAVTTLL